VYNFDTHRRPFSLEIFAADVGKGFNLAEGRPDSGGAGIRRPDWPPNWRVIALFPAACECSLSFQIQIAPVSAAADGAERPTIPERRSLK